LRDFFPFKILSFLALALCLCLLLLAATTVFWSGHVSFADKLLGILITPIQKGVAG
jgi:hypothetical protein